MRNEVLAFVYNILPENEKEVLEALEQTETDHQSEKNDDVTNSEEAASGEAEETKEENNQAFYTSSTDASVNALKERLKQSEDQINIF